MSDSDVVGAGADGGTLADVTTTSEEVAPLPEARTVDIRGPVAYREWPGPDHPIFVCAHGLGGSSVNWMSVAGPLARRGRVLAPDLVGFGRTPRLGRSSTMSANRRVLSEFIRTLTVPPVVLMGNSMGGAVAIMQSAYEPSSAAALVLTSPALPWAWGARPSPLVAAGFALYRTPRIGEWFIRSRTSHLGPERLIRESFKIIMADPASIDPRVVAEHVEVARDRAGDPDAIPAFLEAARSMLRLGDRTSFVTEVMDRVDVPVLVIHGEQDRLVPVELARRLVRAHPSWDLVTLPGVGHAAQIEVPDLWVRAVEEWLDGVNLLAGSKTA